MKELVVARYQENIDWIISCTNLDKIRVYDKYYQGHNTLENVGRESHTYLSHIIKNYENLSNHTIFCQGDPIAHDHNFLPKIQNIDTIIEQNASKGLYFFGIESQEPITGIQRTEHSLGLPTYYFLDLLFDMKIYENININYYCGAQFMVSKNNILNRPKDFYEFLINFVSYDLNPIEGYIFERLWQYIFDTNIPLSKQYKLFL